MEEVILVDTQDQEIGLMEKMEAHEKGLLHRAFSIFVFNDKNELLMQQRAKSKYHSGGLWTNTCCSHPRKGETLLDAGYRRLQEEMGFQTELNTHFSFIYKAELDNNLWEHELDHVLIGKYNDSPIPNPEEVEQWEYVDIDHLKEDIKARPEHYTEWFKIIFEKVSETFSEIN
ncbi:MAG: isopentenyl-diphosphate Delta-isomerase [Crocinitomicaceae bacterium]|nr:isopentenyl-diphosphate Delta-isomerase [Crocinitomicaceae bacterium]